MKRTRSPRGLQHYKDYEGLIYSKVSSWNGRTGIEWEECISIANLGFAEACAGYNPEKGRFTTYLWRGIDIQFIRYLEHHNRWLYVDTTQHHDNLISTNGHLIKFLDRLLDLSGRSQNIAARIVENPDEFCYKGQQVTRSNGALAGKIAKMGYSWRTARKIINEIKLALRED